jgi:hypothetical protein
VLAHTGIHQHITAHASLPPLQVAPGDVSALQQRLRAAGQQQYLVGVKGGKVLVVLHAEASSQDKLRAHVHGTKLAALLLRCDNGRELPEVGACGQNFAQYAVRLGDSVD